MTAEELFNKRQLNETYCLNVINVEGHFIASKYDIIDFAEAYYKSKVEIENTKYKNAIQSIIDLQAKFYGHGIDLHLAMITKSKELKELLNN
jgi:hypothetical protein